MQQQHEWDTRAQRALLSVQSVGVLVRECCSLLFLFSFSYSLLPTPLHSFTAPPYPNPFATPPLKWSIESESEYESKSETESESTDCQLAEPRNWATATPDVKKNKLTK